MAALVKAHVHVVKTTCMSKSILQYLFTHIETIQIAQIELLCKNIIVRNNKIIKYFLMKLKNIGLATIRWCILINVAIETVIR